MNNQIKYLILILALLGSITVLAQTDPKKQKSKKTVANLLSQYKSDDVKRGKDIKLNKYSLIFPTSKESQPTAPARNIMKIKPPSTVQFFIEGDQSEDQIEKLLDQQISELYTINRKFSKSPERGELWLRLGELYVEKAKLISFRVQADFDKKLVAWEAAGRKGNKPKFDSYTAKEFNRKAIELYDWYVKDFPNSNKTDQALFFLGYNYFEIDKPQRGIEFYEELTRRFPQSKYITESHFALAEYYFDNDDWKKALINYRKVVEYKESRVYPFAMYKMAWCDYRLGQINLGIQTLEQVIAFSKRQARLGARGDKQVNKIRLSKEAYNDLIIYFSEARGFNTAKDYFTTIGGEKILFPTLEKLAYIYSDKGQREAARYIFKQLLDMDPMNPKAFDFHYQIVLNYWSAGSRKTFRQELYDWVVEYGKDSEWAKQNPSHLADSDKLREKTLREYVLQLHQTAQKTGTNASQKQAKNGYDLYMSQFPRAENLADMKFYYGDLLFDMGLYEEASDQLRWVIKNAPKSPNFKAAILNNVLALEKRLPTEEQLAKIRGDTLTPLAYTPKEAEFLDNATQYVQQFPREEKVIEIKFRIGRLNYNHNEFDKAIIIFQDIVKNHSTTQYAVYSANLILDIYNLRKDYDNLAKAGNQFLNTPGLNSKLIDLDVKSVVERARFKKAEDAEKNKDYAQSAKDYEAFLKEYPSSNLSTSAQFNAGINYERGGMVLPEIKMYNGVLARPTKEKESDRLKKEARRLLGGLYDKTGQLRRAAIEFEKYAQDYPKDPLSADLIYNAGVIWSAQQSYQKALTDFELYLKTVKKMSARVDTIFLMAEINEKRNSIKKANELFEQYLNSGATDSQKIVEVHMRIAKNFKKIGQESKYEEWIRKTISVQKRLAQKDQNVGAREAAEARFTQTQRLFNDLRSIRLSGSPKTQAENFKKKLSIIDQLNKELAQIVNYDVGDYVVAALATLGQAYEHMAGAIFSAPVPADIKTAEEKKEYAANIDKVAAPMKQKASENYNNAISKASALEFYNEWVVAAHDGLARMNNNLRPVKEEILIDHQVDTTGL